ncbi:YkgJ family cysteine cluster protein [Candidatus Reidiella endopervernicosa]|uniref:YkgJ family cysteine cluster protein n=1 Tax=Candidatus Reidiella endopervernicosa TaxID=2738883 RepID=A0A6N0HRP0_9GAMM|nr:YkgJ family cysteine cluster protein [Candidatus Reidiella endopervernicosa]QKQ24930.1 YkgJ family cysteine cluster protein [Candidatus Reidiella endopervernicosa]
MSLIEDSPFDTSPVAPVEYSPDSEISFRCHKGVDCWNACCRQIDITLTPYDIVRLKNRLGMSSEEFLKKYTAPFEFDRHGVPGIKMRTQEDAPVCLFMDEVDGCTVYEDRPTSCRYYPVGLLSKRNEKEYTDRTGYVLVEEEHCHGHREDRKITIGDYRKDQGVEVFDEEARPWRQLLLKKLSSGPTIGKPSPQSLSLFFMACYNHDKFREFVNAPSFTTMFDISDEEMKRLNEDDVALMHFGFKFLAQVLFGEQSIPLKEGAADKRTEERKETWELRREAEAEIHRAKQEQAEKETL